MKVSSKTKDLKILGIIPARGGSKGVPRKNIRLLKNEPLIAYTIREARKSRLLTRLVTSTDNEEIKKIAENLGSEVIGRPPEIAEDQTPMAPVVEHVLKVLGEKEFDFLILLQPTCPFRKSLDIDQSLQLLIEADADAVISVCRVFDMHPGRMYIMEDDRLFPFKAEWETERRQDLPPLFHRNGSIYAVKTEVFLEKKTFFPKKIRPYIMPPERSVNIDEEIDFQFAEFLMRKKNVEDS